MSYAEYKKAIGEYSIEATPMKVIEDKINPLIQEAGTTSQKDQEDLLFGQDSFTSDDEELSKKGTLL